MKYVRTETGHICECYDEETIYLEDGVEISRDKRTVIKNCIDDLNVVGIVKEADTIEELCDELVVYNPNNDGKNFSTYFVFQCNWKSMLNEKTARSHIVNYEKRVIVYGAIWTEKGLIYVAKMNEKGVLELL